MDNVEEYNYIFPGTNISIKDVQKVELEILDELDRVCKLKNISYQLAWGTLLGAVRHKGFIPWDYDIDVHMDRNNYERFLQEGVPELKEEYVLQTYFTDPDSVVHFAKIRKKGTVYAEPADSPSVVNNGIWIDIFPLENVKPGTLSDWFLRLRAALYFGIITSSVKYRIDQCKPLPKRLLRYVFAGLLKIVPKRIFDEKFQKVIKKYSNCDTGYLALIAWGLNSKIQYKCVIPADKYYDMTELEFCGKMYPAPVNYDYILKTIYGDYMKLPPEKERQPKQEGIRVEI